MPDDSHYPVLVVADDVTFADGERPLLLIDLDGEPGRTFRAVPEAFRSAIANLAIQNLGFEDYLGFLDAAGVYRLSDRHRQALAELQRAHQSAEAPARGFLARSTREGWCAAAH